VKKKKVPKMVSSRDFEMVAEENKALHIKYDGIKNQHEKCMAIANLKGLEVQKLSSEVEYLRNLVIKCVERMA
jgi:hemerythrin